MNRSRAVSLALKSLRTCLDFSYVELPIEAWEAIDHHFRMVYEVGWEQRQSQIYTGSKNASKQEDFVKDLHNYIVSMNKLLKQEKIDEN